MSKKVTQDIDLNCEAVSVDRENEGNDVNVEEAASGAGTSTETLADGIVGGVRDSGEGNELRTESRMESVRNHGIDLEANIGSTGQEDGDKVGAGLSSSSASLMEVDGGSRGCGDGDGVSMEDKKAGGSEEGSSGGVKSQDMEIDTPDANRNQTAAIEAGNDGNAENGSNKLKDAVDSNPCISTDEDASGDVDTKATEPEFCVSDLVWGKVRSHPWWPGQIFDRSDATPKAKKYFKKDCYLIAYYGDQTFAWNDVSRIKPFRPHFSHMEKQNNVEEFHYAIDCALEEVSRRVEFSLACPCISKEAYAQVKTQIIVNAGIREESSRKDGGDRFSTAASFDPFELVERIKALAQSPSYCELDRLQVITSQAQLLAFHRWKGYSELPEFQYLPGLLESDAEIPLLEKVEKCSELIGNDVPSVNVDKDKQKLSGREEPENKDGPSRKQKKLSGDGILSSKKETSLSEPENEDGSSHEQKKIPRDAKVPIKREKSLSEFMAERHLNMQNAKRKLNSKGGDKVISSSPAKKLKADDSVHNDSGMKQNKSNALTQSPNKSLQSKQTFRVGASILRVASQLNGSGSTISSPALKHDDGASKRSALNNKSKGKCSPGKSLGKKVSQMNISSPKEMLSLLCLAAADPLKRYSFLELMIFFFTELRNSIAMDLDSSEMSEQSSEQETDGEKVVKSTRSKITGKSELTSIKDSCCSGRIIKCLPEEQLAVDKHNLSTEVSPNTASVESDSVFESKVAVEASPDMDSERKCTVTDERIGVEAEEWVAVSDENCREDQSPTALILKFSDLDSVPSVEELIKIFSGYGPLVAPGAEVLKKSCQAKVVYKRCADAETAFSSSGKYSLFGPSLVSYRLKRLASSPTKASPASTKRGRTDETYD